MKSRFRMSSGAILLLSALYFFGGIISLSALLLAAAVHELGHIIIIKLLGGGIKSFSFEASGMCMSLCGINNAASEAAVLLAGPAAGLIFALICSYFGVKTANRLLLECAGYGILLTAYNLLPALPLDGGRAAYVILSGAFGCEKAGKILGYSGFLTGLCLSVAGLLLLGKELGAALMIAGIWILTAQTGIVKNMCL